MKQPFLLEILLSRGSWAHYQGSGGGGNDVAKVGSRISCGSPPFQRSSSSGQSPCAGELRVELCGTGPEKISVQAGVAPGPLEPAGKEEPTGQPAVASSGEAALADGSEVQRWGMGEELQQELDSMGVAADLVENAIVAAADTIIIDLASRVVEEENGGSTGAITLPGSSIPAELAEEEVVDVPPRDATGIVVSAGYLSPRGLVEQHGGGGVEPRDVSLNLHLDQVSSLDPRFQKAKARGVRASIPSDRELRSVSKKSQNTFHVLSHD